MGNPAKRDTRLDLHPTTKATPQPNAVRDHVALERRQRWLEANREAITDYNARIERDGLTLARYRRV